MENNNHISWVNAKKKLIIGNILLLSRSSALKNSTSSPHQLQRPMVLGSMKHYLEFGGHHNQSAFALVTVSRHTGSNLVPETLMTQTIDACVLH